MRTIGQVVSVIAVALGIGLLVGGSSIDPVLRPEHLGEVMRSMNGSMRNVEFYNNLAIALKGFGAGFLTLGILGLVVPWVNVIIYGIGSLVGRQVNGRVTTDAAEPARRF